VFSSGRVTPMLSFGLFWAQFSTMVEIAVLARQLVVVVSPLNRWFRPLLTYPYGRFALLLVLTLFRLAR